MKVASCLVVVFAGLIATSAPVSAAKMDVKCKSGLAKLTPVVTPAAETPAPAQSLDQDEEYPEVTEAPVEDPSTEEDTTPTMAPDLSADETDEIGSDYDFDGTEEEVGSEADEDWTTPAPEEGGDEADEVAATPTPEEEEIGGDADEEATTPAPEVGGEAETQITQTSTASQDGVDPVSCLAAHNKLRAEVGVAPLVWDPELASKGAAWAQHMEDLNFFDHRTPGQSDDQMNNLYSGTDCLGAVAAFGGEKASFPADHIVREETYMEYGHYSMVVWRDTTRVGCGRGTTQNLACYYETPGNMVGVPAY